MHIMNISVIQGDMEIETDLNGTMKVKKASTKPSKISISYSPEDDGKIPYKNYDMVVTDKLIKGGVLQDGGRTVIKECIAIMPKEGMYTQDLNQVLYFRNDSNWYMKSVLDPNTKAWPELKREKLSCKTYQKQDVLMVPLRYIINGLENSKLEMKGKKLSASFTMNHERQSLNLEIVKKGFELNGKKKEARVVPEIKQGMTFVSIEDIAK